MGKIKKRFVCSIFSIIFSFHGLIAMFMPRNFLRDLTSVYDSGTCDRSGCFNYIFIDKMERDYCRDSLDSSIKFLIYFSNVYNCKKIIVGLMQCRDMFKNNIFHAVMAKDNVFFLIALISLVCRSRGWLDMLVEKNTYGKSPLDEAIRLKSWRCASVLEEALVYRKLQQRKRVLDVGLRVVVPRKRRKARSVDTRINIEKRNFSRRGSFF